VLDLYDVREVRKLIEPKSVKKRQDFTKNFVLEIYFLFLQPESQILSDGVTGNTSDFGSEESRFEPWSDNKEPSFFLRALLHLIFARSLS
jgi:hypothetical protein